MTLEQLNAMPYQEASQAFYTTCASERFCTTLVERRPFADADELLEAAEVVFDSLGPKDWREAFLGHPKIGDLKSLRKKYTNTKSWTEGEQAGAMGADESVLKGLAEGNLAYEARFGFIFIVCATGKSAAQMLQILTQRLRNSPEEELKIAAHEQWLITRLRLQKLIQPRDTP